MNINHSVKGNGPCVVFLHGLMENLHIWDDFSERLSDYFKVICIDLPGHGETPVVDEVHTMQFMAECVDAVLKAYAIKECVIVGHSMGGYVMATFAKMFPEKLKGICFFHSHVLEDSDEVKRNRERTAALIMNDKLKFIATFIPDLFTSENQKIYADEIAKMVEMAQTMDSRGIAAAQLGMKERSGSLDMLTEIAVPVLFIIGKQDPRISLDKMMAQAMLPKHSEILLLNNVGHVGFIEAKQKTFDTIESFADRCFSY